MSGNVIFESQIPTAKKRGCCIRFPLVTKLFEVVLLHEDITQRDLKNAAERSRQHAGKKYREYAQRYVTVCASSINKSLDTTTIEMYSFALVLFA